MKSNFYSFIFISLLAFCSCKSATKMYQQGRYDEAVELAAKNLSKKPNDAAQLDILQNAYRFAVQDHESRIRNYSNSTSDLRYENIYQEYLDLQRLYDAIRRSASVYEVVQPTDYSSYIQTYQEEAGNARYERGLEMMNIGSKKSSRDAYFEFQKALALKPGDIGIKQKMEEALDAATTNIVITPLTHFGYQYTTYFFDYNNFNYNVLSYLNYNNRNNFTRFYSPAEAGNKIRTDQVVDMRFSDVNIGRYRDNRNVREVSKQIVAKEIVIKPDSVIREYITVRARITTTTRRLQADGLLQVTIRDTENRRIWSETYRGDYNWITSFASYTGDERALSDEDRRLINQREQWPPSNDEIIRIIMGEIQHKTQCGISDFYNRSF